MSELANSNNIMIPSRMHLAGCCSKFQPIPSEPLRRLAVNRAFESKVDAGNATRGNRDFVRPYDHVATEHRVQEVMKGESGDVYSLHRDGDGIVFSLLPIPTLERLIATVPCPTCVQHSSCRPIRLQNRIDVSQINMYPRA